MKKFIPFLVAALAFAATSCLDINPDNVDDEIASVDVEDVKFETSITYKAADNLPAGTNETIVYSDKSNIEYYLKNYSLKGSIEVKGEVVNNAASSVTVSCVFKGVNGKDIKVKLDGKDKMSFGAGKTTPVTISFSEDKGFNSFDAIEFEVVTDAAIIKNQTIVFKTKTLSASAGVHLK